MIKDVVKIKYDKVRPLMSPLCHNTLDNNLRATSLSRLWNTKMQVNSFASGQESKKIIGFIKQINGQL